MTAHKTSDLVSYKLTQLTGKLADCDKQIIETESGLAVHEWQLLSHLCENPDSRLTEISYILGIDTSDLVMAYSSLSDKRLITIQGDLALLVATDMGQLTYLSVTPKLHKTRDDAMSNLSHDERRQLTQLLNKVSISLDNLLEHKGNHPQHRAPTAH